jgi:hypothetical protein
LCPSNPNPLLLLQLHVLFVVVDAIVDVIVAVEVVEFEEEVPPPVLKAVGMAAKNVTSKVAPNASGKPAPKAATKAPQNDGSKKLTSGGQPSRPLPNGNS